MNQDINLLKKELESIVNASNDNIVVVDREGFVIRVSENSEAIYGKEPSYLIGKSVYTLQQEKIFNPSVSVRVLEEKKEVQVMQETFQGLAVMATGIPVFNESKEIVRVISFSHDLTEIKQLKEDYEELQAKMKRYESEIEELRYKEVNTEGVIIQSKRMKKIWDLVQRMAKSDASVMLLGETGVGKSVFARILHKRGERKKESFIEVNCGAIPASLFEAELFGYAPGAFTGASKKGKVGLIELAHKGTLFLDEIAEIPIDLQVKLLRALEDKQFTRVGGEESVNVDFRIITATNQNLKQKVKDNTFREDLYYRLNVVPVNIPSLRERQEDIHHLIHYYSDKLNYKYKKNINFHPSVIEYLQQYNWPGNIRQLENLIEQLIAMTDGKTIYFEDLPTEIKEYFSVESNLSTFTPVLEEIQESTLQESLQRVEKEWLKRAYRQHKTTYEMASFLGISQSTVVRRLKEYNINS